MTSREPGGVRLGLLIQRWASPDRPFGGLTQFVQTVSELARSEGVEVIAFDPADADLDWQHILGIRWRGQSWAVQEEPLPDVVWNRYFRRDRDDLLNDLKRREIPLFNETALSKWEAYRALCHDPMLQEHLPETHLLAGDGEVVDLCSRYPAVFLKPVAGSVGRGIIRAFRQPTGLVKLQYIARSTGEFREEEASPRQLERWARDRKGTYIVQRGLDLAVFYGRPADVRVLVQKDGTGRWRFTGMGARVAAAGRFTANLHTGGTGVPVPMLMQALFPGDGERQEVLLLELQALAMRAVELLEAESGTMGEVGLDFGVDREGQIWYIEQNAQPGRNIFEHLGRSDLFQLAHLRPIQYARGLALRKSARAADYAST